MKLKKSKNLYQVFYILLVSMITATFIFYLYDLEKRNLLQWSNVRLYILFLAVGLAGYYILKYFKVIKWIVNIAIFLLYCVLMLFVCDDIGLFFVAMIFVALFVFTANTLLFKYSYPQISRNWKIALALSSGFLFILFQGLNIYGSQQMSKVISQIREKSYMLTYKEVNQMYEKNIDAKENGGGLLAACSEIISRSDIPGHIFEQNKEFSEEDFKKIEEYMINHKRELSMLTEILSYEQLVIPLKFSGEAILLPHLSNLTSTAKKMAFISRYEQHIGQSQEALKSIEQIFKIASSLEHDPMIISALVQNSIQRIGAETILRFIQNGATKDDIVTLQNIIAPLCSYKPFPFKLEIIYFYNAIFPETNMSLFERWKLFSNIELPPVLCLSKGFTKMDTSFCLQKILEIDEVQISGEKAVLQRLKNPKYYDSFFYPITSICNLEEAFESSSLAHFAILRCVFLVTQLQLLWLETESYPASINSIAISYPEYATDPFTGGQLVYKNNEKFYSLYSIGKNFMDDDGKNLILSSNGKDIGIQWEK